MKIDEASILDIPELCTLINIAYRGDSSRKGWTTEADFLDGIRIDEAMLGEYFNDAQSTILKCVEDNGEIVGCVYLKKNDEKLYLGLLTVAPGLQGRGIGKQLLQASEVTAANKECKLIEMTVITNRAELIDWYRRNGYAETGEMRPFPTSERFGKPKRQLEFLVMQKMM